MARIYPLFSSSRGNSTFIGNETAGFLIDCGVSYRRLTAALELNRIPISAVKAVFITHEHSDHVSGLKMLTKNTSAAIYGNRRTLQRLCDGDKIAPHSMLIDMNGKKVACADHEISSFNTPHDAINSCGYKIRTPEGFDIAVCTDLGHVTEEVRASLLGCKMVLIESNYDENMLRHGSYPLYLKQRILSPIGHLSNDDCGKFAAELVENGATHILLGHLSQENNRPDIADKTVQQHLGGFVRGRDYIMGVAPVETTGGAVLL